jgi:hypothetical protein
MEGKLKLAYRPPQQIGVAVEREPTELVNSKDWRELVSLHTLIVSSVPHLFFIPSLSEP